MPGHGNRVTASFVAGRSPVSAGISVFANDARPTTDDALVLALPGKHMRNSNIGAVTTDAIIAVSPQLTHAAVASADGKDCIPRGH